MTLKAVGIQWATHATVTGDAGQTHTVCCGHAGLMQELTTLCLLPSDSVTSSVLTVIYIPTNPQNKRAKWVLLLLLNRHKICNCSG